MILSNLKNVISALEDYGLIRSTTRFHFTKNGLVFYLTKDQFHELLYDLENKYNLCIYEPRFEEDHYAIEIGG